MKMIKGLNQFKLLLLLLVLGLTLGACGETTPPKPEDNTPTNEWDSLKWDQSTWG